MKSRQCPQKRRYGAPIYHSPQVFGLCYPCFFSYLNEVGPSAKERAIPCRVYLSNQRMKLQTSISNKYAAKANKGDVVEVEERNVPLSPCSSVLKGASECKRKLPQTTIPQTKELITAIIDKICRSALPANSIIRHTLSFSESSM